MMFIEEPLTRSTTEELNNAEKTTAKRVLQMKEIHEQALELFKRKNTDYGDAFAEFGAIGVIMRIEDKLKRLLSISKNKITLVDDETMKDTLLDLHNYSAMCLMLLNEE